MVENSRQSSDYMHTRTLNITGIIMTYCFLLALRTGGQGISFPNIIHKILTLEKNMHTFQTMTSFFNIYQVKCEEIFVQFFETS